MFKKVKLEQEYCATMQRQGNSSSPSQPNAFQNIAGSSAFSEHALPNEDWTQISDLTERRRVQNRIAQRNYRKKLKQRMGNMEKEERAAIEGSISPRQQSSRDQAVTGRNQYASHPPSSAEMVSGVGVTTPSQPYAAQTYHYQHPYISSTTSESPSSDMVYAERHAYPQYSEQASYYPAPGPYGSPISSENFVQGSVSPHQMGAIGHQPFTADPDSLLGHDLGYSSTMNTIIPVNMPPYEQYAVQPTVSGTYDYHFYDSPHHFCQDGTEQYDPRNNRRS